MSIEAHWIITRTSGKTKQTIRECSPGADALEAFLAACDTGKPGAYTLTGMAARKPLVLASAKVKSHEMSIAWDPAWILFSLGAKGMHGAVAPVLAFLVRNGEWKVEA